MTKCANCGKQGHSARKCRKVTASGSADAISRSEAPAGKLGAGRENLRYFNCHHRGHFAVDCPKPMEAAMQGTATRLQQCPHLMAERVSRKGTVKHQEVLDIILDTGTFRTMVRGSLVPSEKMVLDEVHICCAHGDVITYPLAQVEIGVEHYWWRQQWLIGYPSQCCLVLMCQRYLT